MNENVIDYFCKWVNEEGSDYVQFFLFSLQIYHEAKKPQAYTHSQALKLLKVGKTKLSRLVKEGRIIKFERNRYDLGSLIEYIKSENFKNGNNPLIQSIFYSGLFNNEILDSLRYNSSITKVISHRRSS